MSDLAFYIIVGITGIVAVVLLVVGLWEILHDDYD